MSNKPAIKQNPNVLQKLMVEPDELDVELAKGGGETEEAVGQVAPEVEIERHFEIQGTFCLFKQSSFYCFEHFCHFLCWLI